MIGPEHNRNLQVYCLLPKEKGKKLGKRKTQQKRKLKSNVKCRNAE